jgi:glutaminase
MKSIKKLSKLKFIKNYSKENWNSVGKLLTFAKTGKVSDMKKLLEVEKLEINTIDYDLRTALHVAASEGHTELCKYLIENGAELNPVDRFDHTPSHDALRSVK